MPSCPNCGRKTLRTLDWACQWCGYPLLSKSYKKIDKTFKELQEERNISTRPAPAEEPAYEYNPEPAYRPEISERPTVQPETPVALEPETELPPGPEPAPELTKGPEPEPSTPEAKKPARKRKTKTAPKARKKSRKKAEPAPEPAPEAEPAQEPMITPPPAAETEPMITPPPASEPAAPPTPEPAPVEVPKIDTLAEGQLLTVDGLDALFRENKIATHTALTDKTMKIQGTVEKIFIRDHIDVRYIVLKGAQKKLLWPVRCTFGKEAVNEMYRLREGQEVIIHGRYDGYGKNIIFKDCVVYS